MHYLSVPETLTSPTSSLENTSFDDMPEIIIEGLKNLVGLLKDKIDEANDKHLIPDSTSTLFTTILKGINKLLKGLCEIKKLMDSRAVNFNSKKEGLLEAMDALNQKCNTLTT